MYMHLQYYPKRSIGNVEFDGEDAFFGTGRIQQGSIHVFSQESHCDTECSTDFNALKLQKGFPRISPKTNICRRETQAVKHSATTASLNLNSIKSTLVDVCCYLESKFAQISKVFISLWGLVNKNNMFFIIQLK